VLLRHMHRLDSLNIIEKARMDYASEVDEQAEAAIIEVLRRAAPDDAILGEEGGVQAGASGASRSTWVIDPLDGTSNYLHGIAHWCVSIALCVDGEPTHAVVFDPLHNELFTANRGGGAHLNGQRIRVSERRDLSGSLIASGFSPRERERADAQLDCIKRLLREAEDLRCGGASALDLAHVACGRLDGCFEAGVQPWDMAAGVLLVREATSPARGPCWPGTCAWPMPCRRWSAVPVMRGCLRREKPKAPRSDEHQYDLHTPASAVAAGRRGACWQGPGPVVSPGYGTLGMLVEASAWMTGALVSPKSVRNFCPSSSP